HLFTVQGGHRLLAELLGEEAVAALDREQVVPGQLRTLEALEDSSGSATGDGGPAAPSYACAVLTALWLVAVEVSPQQVDAALPRTGTDGLQQLGLAEVGPAAAAQSRDPVVAPCADLRPYQIEGHSSGTL